MVGIASERLDQLFERAQSLRIAVVGDLMLDAYLSGHVSRISPEAPVPVVQVMEERVALGGAANVAANVAAVGASCDVVGYVGLDAAGMQLREALTAPQVGSTRAHLVERADRPTTTKTRVMARKQQIVRFDRERDDDLPDDCTDELIALLRDLVSHVDALVLEDYNKGVLVPPVIEAALRGAAEAGIPTIVDPKFRRFFEYGGATVFKPNAVEIANAFAAPLDPSDEGKLEAARLRLGCDNLLVTLGEEGMVLRSQREGTHRVPALAREVYDVSGAGDTVTAFLAVVLAAGGSVLEAATIANVAAAIEVTKPGVATVSPDEIRYMCHELWPHAVYG